MFEQLLEKLISLIACLRRLGFSGPFSGGRHEFMQGLSLPPRTSYPHGGDIGSLRQAGIDPCEWERPAPFEVGARTFRYNTRAGAVLCGVCLALLKASLSLAVPADDRRTLPDDFLKAAKAFQSAPLTNRILEARALSQTLPKCPLVSEQDIGTGILRAYDFSRPSFLLNLTNIVSLLGNPSNCTTNGRSVILSFQLDAQAEKPASLWIELRDNRVIGAVISGSAVVRVKR